MISRPTAPQVVADATPTHQKIFRFLQVASYRAKPSQRIFRSLVIAPSRIISPGMKPPTRRHRHSDRPLGRPYVIEPEFLHERYVRALKWLEPYHYCKYATAPWLHFLADPDLEYSVFRKYLGYLREESNRYIG